MFGKRDLRGRVIVITGASSGIGRAAAIAFGNAGARVVLAARGAAALERTARLVEAGGGEALVVPTDVTIEDEARTLVHAAITRYGSIDVWVNNAGITLFARIEEAPIEEHLRVIETNLFGPIYCTRAVLPVFRAQGRGTLIYIGSILSKVGQPYVPSYTMSKFALGGLAQAVRVEVSEEPGIDVSLVLPYAVDTPHFEVGANHEGWEPRAMPPVQSPEKVARAIVSVARRPRPEVHVPRVAVLGLALRRLFPHTTDRLLLRALRKWHFDRRDQPATEGNLFAPIEVDAVRGERPPRIRTWAFFAWAAGELLSIAIGRRLRGSASEPRPARRPAVSDGARETN